MADNQKRWDRARRLYENAPGIGERVGWGALQPEARQFWYRRAAPLEVRHVGECATDETSRQVCDGMYADRLQDNLALCEALRAVYVLAGENKEIARIVNEAIAKHGAGQ